MLIVKILKVKIPNYMGLIEGWYIELIPFIVLFKLDFFIFL